MSTQPGSGTEQRDELRRLLMSGPLFQTLSGEAMADVVDACELVSAPGGTYLLRAGEAIDALYGVLYGGLRLSRVSHDDGERTVRELYRGEMLGVLGMFIERAVPIDVLVIRDSLLVRLERARFLALAQKHPELLKRLAHVLSEHALDLLEATTGTSRAVPSRGGNLTLIPMSAPSAIGQTVRGLIDVLTADRAVKHVSAETIDRALGAGTADSDSAQLTEWLGNLERSSRGVLYVGDTGRPRWTARSVRQSDRLVVIVAADDEGRIDEIAASIARERTGGVDRRVDLVCVHPSTSDLPSGARAWTRLRVSGIHHARAGRRGDLERIARHLHGRPVGVVLGGGGARGLAHLGVLAAILEAEIPIDYICGTSIGAIFGAAVAQGWSIDRMREMTQEVFTPLLALYDFTLPVSSILAGKKLDRVLHDLYGDADIEDLWLPFFCVSTDLSRATHVLHDTGSVWQSVRASCSIPGLFPPLVMDGRALVDGGLMDNLPIDLMAERCPGPLIAVDVFPYGDPTFMRPAGAIAQRLRALRTRLKGAPASPPLFDILMRSTLVGSKFRLETATARLPDVVHLSPPVTSFGILQWRAHRELFDAGYAYAREQLSQPRQGELLHAA